MAKLFVLHFTLAQFSMVKVTIGHAMKMPECVMMKITPQVERKKE